MARLILLRHAEAGPPGGGDQERPLTERGREMARGVGRRLRELDLRPDLALVSAARRTRETWECLAEGWDAITVRIEERLYVGAADTLLEVLRETETQFGTVLVVAHNPAVEDLARLLVGVADPSSQARLMQTFSPATFAVVDVPTADWRDVEPRLGRLEHLIPPRGQGG